MVAQNTKFSKACVTTVYCLNETWESVGGTDNFAGAKGYLRASPRHTVGGGGNPGWNYFSIVSLLDSEIYSTYCFLLWSPLDSVPHDLALDTFLIMGTMLYFVFPTPPLASWEQWASSVCIHHSAEPRQEPGWHFLPVNVSVKEKKDNSTNPRKNKHEWGTALVCEGAVTSAALL